MHLLHVVIIVFMQCLVTLVFAKSEIEELVVTGTHVPLAHEEIGSSYTIITAKDIAQRQAILVSDLLREIPGFSVSRSGVVGSQTQVRVRGSEANHLLVLIDGIEANDVVSSEFDFAHLLTSNIERIEIIRGPQSALYGSDALAGVINIITKKGQGITQLSSTIEVGLPNMLYLDSNVSAGTDNYYYNLQGSYLKSAGHNIALNGDENDDYNNATFSLNIGANPVDNLKFDLVARHVSAENETDNSNTGIAIDADESGTVSQTYLRGQIAYNTKKNSWQHLLNISLNQTNNDSFTGITRSYLRGKKVSVDYQTNFYFQTQSTSQVLIFSADHETNSFQQDFFGKQKHNLQSTGIVGAYEINFAKQIFFSSSIRRDNNSDFKNSITHRHTLAYILPSLNMRLHGSYGTGIKNPTFFERFGFSPAFPFIGNSNLTPEKSKSWDIGIDQSIWSEKITIGLTYFHANLQDEIVATFITAENSNGTSNREGIEVTTDIQLINNIKLKTTYTWTHSQQEGTQREVRRPRHLASLNIAYTSPNKIAKINVNTTFTGQQQDNIFRAPLFIPETVTLDDYILVNIATSYAISPKTSVYGRIENLFDKKYQDVFSFATPGITGIIGLKMAL